MIVAEGAKLLLDCDTAAFDEKGSGVVGASSLRV